ncbi:Protein fmp52, mitochondrial [Ascosphaera acerosa]|nr:Protein fmp52, mitochondrial [Ascosphaera acerosa]
MCRNSPHVDDEKLDVWLSHNLISAYPNFVRTHNPAPDIMFCAISISTKEVGGRKNQQIIEYELPLRIAKAAREAGTKVFVLTSISHFPYGRNIAFLRMKEQLERDIQSLGFDRVVIVRVPIVFGLRDEGSTTSGLVLHALGNVKNFFRWPMRNGWQRRASQTAHATINAGLDALEVPDAPRVCVLRSRDIPKVAKRRKPRALRSGRFPPPTRVRECSL